MALLGRLARLATKNGAAGALDPNAAQPVFFSALEEAIRGASMNKAPAQQWLATIKNPQAGVKRQELDWSGIEDYLNTSAGTPGSNQPATVSRDDLLQFMEQAKEKYRPDETFLSKDDFPNPEMSKEEWLEQNRLLIEREKQHQIESKFNGEFVYPDIIAEPAVKPPVRDSLSYIDDHLRSYEREALSARNRGDITAVADAAYYQGEVDRLKADRQRLIDWENRDVDTINLFTGKSDRELQGKFRVRLRGGRTAQGQAIEKEFKRLFGDRYSAEEYGRKLADRAHDREKAKFIKEQQDVEEYLTRALKIVERRKPRAVGRPARLEYQNHSLDSPRGEDYEELLLTLPSQKGQYRTSHYNNYNDLPEDNPANRGPIFAHVRFQTRYAPKTSPEQRAELDAMKQAQQARKDEYHNLMNQGHHVSHDTDGGRRMSALMDQMQEHEDKVKAFERSLPRTKILTIEEIQSDWHQYARNIGGYKENDPAKLEVLRGEAQKAIDEWGKGPVNATALMVTTVPAIRSYLERRIGQAGYAGSEMVEDALRMARGQGRVNYSEKIVRDWTLKHLPKAVNDAKEVLKQEAAAGSTEAAEALEKIAQIEPAMKKAFQNYRRPVGAYDGGTQGPPKAPFSDNVWARVAMKRMLRYAADNGYDEIAWSGQIKNGKWGSATNIFGGTRGHEFYDNVLVSAVNDAVKKGGGRVGKRDVIDGYGPSWNNLALTPEVIEFIKKSMPLFAVPAAAGLGAAATGGGLLSRVGERGTA